MTVRDTTPPIISLALATPFLLWPPDHRMVSVRINYLTSDQCHAHSCRLTVRSNEPVNGTGDGNTAVDWQIVDDHQVLLRAERSAQGHGRLVHGRDQLSGCCRKCFKPQRVCCCSEVTFRSDPSSIQ